MTPLLPPWLTLPALVLLYRPLARLFPRMDRDAYVRRVVCAANLFFRKRFSRIPHGERALFLPYCLRPAGCPTEIDAGEGLVCRQECLLPCRLREIRELAFSLGYLDVCVVVSGRLHGREGVPRSRDFLVERIRKGGARGVIGCLCTRDFREKYLAPEHLSFGGILKRHGSSVIPQVYLLRDCNCRSSSVDWQGLADCVRLEKRA